MVKEDSYYLFFIKTFSLYKKKKNIYKSQSIYLENFKAIASLPSVFSMMYSLTLHIDNIKMYGLVSSDDYT